MYVLLEVGLRRRKICFVEVSKPRSQATKPLSYPGQTSDTEIWDKRTSSKMLAGETRLLVISLRFWPGSQFATNRTFNWPTSVGISWRFCEVWHPQLARPVVGSPVMV